MEFSDPAATSDATSRMWTARLRNKVFGTFPPEKLLPDRQPAYVDSWIYVFGVASIAAFIILVVTGLVLTFEGPAWYHVSGVGHFVNSLHFWTVQLFMLVLTVHLFGKFWMAAWRGKRLLTWITGALAFFSSIGTAFTGFLVETNFESQWIAFEAKDGLNAGGVGAWFNVADTGQMLLIHVALLPLVVAGLIVWHILLVRHRGVVPPIPLRNPPVTARDQENMEPVTP
jgi:ubiquinol-cytochrome c reductase cytochrome b subunit